MARAEFGQAWLEQITYNMTKMDYKAQSDYLGGPIGLLKYQLTRNLHFVADHAYVALSAQSVIRSKLKQSIKTAYKLQEAAGSPKVNDQISE